MASEVIMLHPDSRLEELQASVEQAQATLDKAHRALAAIDEAHQRAERLARELQRAGVVLAVGGTVVACVILLHHRAR